MKRETIDLQEEAIEIWTEDVEELQSTLDEMAAKLDEKYEDYSEVPEKKVEAYDRIRAELEEQAGFAKAIARALIEWSPKYDTDAFENEEEMVEELPLDVDSTFVISELSTGALGAIQDEVQEASFDFDPETGDVEGVPKQGFGMVVTLRKGIERQPDIAPTREDGLGREVIAPADYPHKVGVYLFNRIDDLNTTGGTELGNSSLRERMTSDS